MRYELHTTLDGGRVVLCPSTELEILAGQPAAADAIDAARTTLAAALGVDPAELPAPLTTEGTRWTDMALGCAAAGENPAPANIEGYRFTFLLEGELYDLRTSTDGAQGGVLPGGRATVAT